MGGISKSFYFGGMIIAHIVALRMYKAALISDIYMVQDEENHNKKKQTLKNKNKKQSSFKTLGSLDQGLTGTQIQTPRSQNESEDY